MAENMEKEMENRADYAIFELFEQLKHDDSLGDDPEERARLADSFYLMLGWS